MNPKELRALQLKWYRKLKRSGFSDIEAVFNDKAPERLNRHDNVYFQIRNTPQDVYSKTTYYAEARSLCHTYTFETPAQQKAWELHAEGQSITEIALAMRKPRTAVHNLIKPVKETLLNVRPKKR